MMRNHELAHQLNQTPEAVPMIRYAGLWYEVSGVETIDGLRNGVTFTTDASEYKDELTTTMRDKANALRLNLSDDDQKIATMLYRAIEEIEGLRTLK